MGWFETTILGMRLKKLSRVCKNHIGTLSGSWIVSYKRTHRTGNWCNEHTTHTPTIETDGLGQAMHPTHHAPAHTPRLNETDNFN